MFFKRISLSHSRGHTARAPVQTTTFVVVCQPVVPLSTGVLNRPFVLAARLNLQGYRSLLYTPLRRANLTTL